MTPDNDEMNSYIGEGTNETIQAHEQIEEENEDTSDMMMAGLDGLWEEAELEQRLATALSNANLAEAQRAMKDLFTSVNIDVVKYDEYDGFVGMRRLVVDATLEALSSLLREGAESTRIRDFLTNGLVRIQEMCGPYDKYDRASTMFQWCVPPVHWAYSHLHHKGQTTDWDVVLDVVRTFPQCSRIRSSLASTTDLPLQAAIKSGSGASFAVVQDLIRVFLETVDEDGEQYDAVLEAMRNTLRYALTERATVAIVTEILTVLRSYDQKKVAATGSTDSYFPSIGIAYREEHTDWQVILAVVNAYPESASHESTLPIHVAAAYSESVDVIRGLLDVYPVGISRTAPSFWYAPNEPHRQLLPLHFAVSSENKHRNEAVVQELLKRDASAAKKRDSHAYCSLDHFLPLVPIRLEFQEGDVGIVQRLIDAYPDALRRKLGATALAPLHRLAMRPIWDDAAAGVARVVLQAWPRAARIPNRLGYYPLQVVCGESSNHGPTPIGTASPLWSLEAFKQLLQAHPKAAGEPDNDGCTPFHRACFFADPGYLQELVRVFPEGARMPTRLGELPLHLICRFFCGQDGTRSSEVTLRLCRLLLEAYPDGARVRDSDGCFPLHTILRSWRNSSHDTTVLPELFDLVLRTYSEAIFLPIGITVELREAQNFARSHHEFRVRTILEMALTGDIPHVDGIDTLLTKAYPDRHPSDFPRASPPSGLPPIHAACALASTPFQVALAMAVRTLHNRFPHDSKTPCRPKGRLPLHWAFHAKTPPSMELLVALVDVFGGALSLPDRNGLTPFEVACLRQPSKARQRQTNVDTLYFLLRERPDLVHRWLQPGPIEENAHERTQINVYDQDDEDILEHYDLVEWSPDNCNLAMPENGVEEVMIAIGQREC